MFVALDALWYRSNPLDHSAGPWLPTFRVQECILPLAELAFLAVKVRFGPIQLKNLAWSSR